MLKMQTILTIQCALKPLLNKVAPQNHNHKGLQGEYLKPINLMDIILPKSSQSFLYFLSHHTWKSNRVGEVKPNHLTVVFINL